MRAVKERPIIFSPPMVRSLLEGTKTQTRRHLYAMRKFFSSACFHRDYPPPPVLTPVGKCWALTDWRKAKTGDVLWVRETCRADELPSGLDGVRYLADDSFTPIENSEEAAERWGALACYGMKKSGTAECRKVPAIHMPRWASRILLEISEVRVERLNDISEADAKAEGVSWNRNPGAVALHGAETARDAYRTLWDQINGDGSWNANPWVWRISFRRITP